MANRSRYGCPIVRARLPRVRQRHDVVALHLDRRFSAAFELDRLARVRGHPRCRATTLQPSNFVPVRSRAEDIVALITAVAVGVFPRGAALVPVIACLRPVPLHRVNWSTADRAGSSPCFVWGCACGWPTTPGCWTSPWSTLTRSNGPRSGYVSRSSTASACVVVCWLLIGCFDGAVDVLEAADGVSDVVVSAVLVSLSASQAAPQPSCPLPPPHRTVATPNASCCISLRL